MPPSVVGTLISRAGLVVVKALDQFRGDPLWAGRSGGYFCIADGKTGLPVFVAIIGDIPVENAARYWGLCQEKATRLAGYPNHCSSWQSRNPEAMQYAGAIRVRNLIFSFSGLSEAGDEAAMLLVAVSIGAEGLFAETMAIAALSQNKYCKPLLWIVQSYGLLADQEAGINLGK